MLVGTKNRRRDLLRSRCYRPCWDLPVVDVLGLVRPLLYTKAVELTEFEVPPVRTVEREDGDHNPLSLHDVNQDLLRRKTARRCRCD
jgi:hypothetical protein